MSQEQTMSVELPEQLIEQVDDRLQRTEFDSPEAYITFVIEEVLSRTEQEADDDDFEDVDEDEVRDRLESLGYLNN